MGYLFGLFFIFFLLGMLWAFGTLLIEIAGITFPAWGAAVAIVILTFYMFRSSKVRSLGLSGNSEGVFSFGNEGMKLTYRVNEDAIEKHVSVDLAYVVAIFLTVVVFLIVLNALDGRGAFRGLTFSLWWANPDSITPEVGFAFAWIPAIVAVITVICIVRPKKALRDALRKRATDIANHVNTEVSRTGVLLGLEDSVKSIARELGSAFPVDFHTEIKYYVSSHKEKVLSDTTELQKLIDRNTGRAMELKLHIEKAQSHYKAVDQFYGETARIVNRTRRSSFIEELDDYHEGLTSDKLKSYIAEGNWDDFHNTLNAIKEGLGEVGEIAANYQAGMYDEYEEEPAGIGSPTESDEDLAYQILELTPTASNEQITKEWRRLSFEFHPDRLPGKDDTRMKGINWAYDILKEKRNFT